VIGHTAETFFLLRQFVRRNVKTGGSPMPMAYTHYGWAATPSSAAAPEIPSDEVFRQIADGSHHAMRTLFERHCVPIYRWLLRIAGDAAVAEDLLSDVFFDVWQNAARFKGRSSGSTWLLAIARNKAQSAARRGEHHGELASTVAQSPNDPELVVQKKSREEVLRHSLARLSPQHGEVMDLVYYHGKSIKEIADIVGINEAAVKQRMLNARKQLAELRARTRQLA
jgi:RNA polymerase sigma-70 factor (ECF subfamily)